MQGHVSLCIVSGKRLLSAAGCVASSHSYYCRCWTGYLYTVYTSLTNAVHMEETI